MNASVSNTDNRAPGSLNASEPRVPGSPGELFRDRRAAEEPAMSPLEQFIARA